MKFKRLMLVTLVLLAILTIGAASASDDAASDDLAVSDEDSVVAGPENDGGYDINPVIDPDDEGDESSEGGDEPSEEIWINDWGDIAQQEDSVVSVKAKNDTDYTLDIVLKAENYEELDTELSTIELNSSFENKGAWEENDSFTIYDIRLKDVNFAGVNDGDILELKSHVVALKGSLKDGHIVGTHTHQLRHQCASFHHISLDIAFHDLVEWHLD